MSNYQQTADSYDAMAREKKRLMTDEEIPEGFDPRKFFEELRKSASIKMGAMMFGEAQMAYYDVLKGHMPEEQAYNMLAHTTESVVKGVASAAGPVIAALLQGVVIWERLGMMPQSDKEMPGGGS